MTVLSRIPKKPLLGAFAGAVAVITIACAARVVPPVQLRVVEVGFAERNRCSGPSARICTATRDCPRGEQCLSLLATDAPSFGRDGGHTLRIADRVLWMFGDTFSPVGMLSNTSGWSRLTDPQHLSEATDGAGLPIQFLPFTAEEEAFNRDHAELPDCCADRVGCSTDAPYCNCSSDMDCAARIALWPGDGVAHGERGSVYYEKFVIGAAPYDFRRVGVGVARVERQGATALREVDADGEPLMIFGETEPGFARGVVVNEDRQRLYAYASVNRSGCAVDVVIARVETPAMADRSAYEFWDGARWQPFLDRAQPILEQIPGGLGSVMWNTYLNAYLSGWSDLCTGGRSFHMRTASRPEGPWGPARIVDLTRVGAASDAYYGLLHPEFGSGRNLLITFFQPVDEVYGQMRVARLTLE